MEESKPIVVMRSKKRPIIRLKNFRLSMEDIADLKKITIETNRISNRRKEISETDIVKALIRIGTKIRKNMIIKALTEIQ